MFCLELLKLTLCYYIKLSFQEICHNDCIKASKTHNIVNYLRYREQSNRTKRFITSLNSEDYLEMHYVIKVPKIRRVFDFPGKSRINRTLSSWNHHHLWPWAIVTKVIFYKRASEEEWGESLKETNLSYKNLLNNVQQICHSNPQPSGNLLKDFDRYLLIDVQVQVFKDLNFFLNIQ